MPPTRSYDARHRAPDRGPTRPRRFLASLALPTAAAAAVTFGATGAEVASSTRPVTATQPATAGPTQTAAVDAAQIDSRNRAARAQAARGQAVARFRANAAAKVARSAKRKSLAVAALEAKRAARAHRWQMPIRNPVRTSGFGWRWGRLHAGEDFAVPVGTNLVSMSTGIVVFAGAQSGYGNLVKIRYWDGTVTFYGHMSRIAVTEGERVGPGQVVGQSGNSGRSTGPHLHLEVHPQDGKAVDPLRWLAAHGIGA